MNQAQIQLIISLLAAHVISDFVLQTDQDIKSKNKFSVLFRHGLIVTILSYFLVGYWLLWVIPITIFISHVIIDFVKTKLSSEKIWIFVIDQLIHFGIIIVLAFFNHDFYNPQVSGFWINVFGSNFYIILIFLTGFFIATHVGSIVVGLGVEPFLKEQIDEERSRSSTKLIQTSPTTLGFDKGGKMIGQLERAMIFIFVLASQPSAIGFLIAAKSILRFGEIGSGSKRKEIEYIIIGTFMSFLFGLVTSYVTLIAIHQYQSLW